MGMRRDNKKARMRFGPDGDLLLNEEKKITKGIFNLGLSLWESVVIIK